MRCCDWGRGQGLHDRDVITAYINGVQVLKATDNTYTAGSPGIGFYIEGATAVNGDFGFTTFTATAK